jgi:Proteasome stabiliser
MTCCWHHGGSNAAGAASFHLRSSTELWCHVPACIERMCPAADCECAEATTDVAGRGLRSFTYQAVGQLAARTPQLLAKDVTIAARFFQVQYDAGFRSLAGLQVWQHGM